MPNLPTVLGLRLGPTNQVSVRALIYVGFEQCPIRSLRRWLGRLKNTMTKEKRQLFKAAANKVVKKSKRSDGTTAVSGS